jgi:hypothetical protein
VSAALEHAPPLLVAHDDGIDLWTPYGVIPVLEGREVDVAFPDLAGGVIFSSVERELGELGPIEWIPRIGEEAQVLVDDSDPGQVRPVQVTMVGDRRTLVYREWTELPNDCESDPDPECSWAYVREYLILRDLDTNKETNLGMVGSFESSWVDFSFGGSYATVTSSPYGTENSCVAVVRNDMLVDDASAGRWIGEGSELLESVGLTEPCQGDVRAVVAPDGATYLEVSDGGSAEASPVVTVLAVATGNEIMSAGIPAARIHPRWFDFDGTFAVIGQWDPISDRDKTQPLLIVNLDGTITELDIEGRATLWTPLDAASTVTLRSDGLGPVSFGDPVEEVMADLIGLFGEPTRDVVRENTEWMGIHDGFGVDHYIRFVAWQQVGLHVVMSDGYDLPGIEPGAVLVNWSYAPPSPDPAIRLLTSDGVGVGSTVEDLRAAYGERLSVYWDEFDGWRATLPEALPGAHPPLSGIVFDLTGDPSDPATTVGYMWRLRPHRRPVRPGHNRRLHVGRSSPSTLNLGHGTDRTDGSH